MIQNIFSYSREKILEILEKHLEIICHDEDSLDKLQSTLINSFGNPRIQFICPVDKASEGKAAHRYYKETGRWPYQKSLEYQGTYFSIKQLKETSYPQDAINTIVVGKFFGEEETIDYWR